MNHEQLLQLVSKYLLNKARNELAETEVNEAEIRLQYIDPLVELLGWDIRNQAGAPSHLQDVIVERRLEKDRPDYQLMVNGEPVLTIEAKKASIDLCTSREALLQSRRYGYSLGHACSVLTNFRNLVILDCRQPPLIDDDPRSFIIKVITVDDIALPANIEWIEQHLSRSAISSSQSPLIQLEPDAITVDSRFVDDLARWRLKIANTLFQALIPSPSIIEVEKDVRRLVDQIVFLRVAEAKSGQEFLRHCLEPGFDFEGYRSLLNRSRQVFNSELFNNLPSLPSRLSDEQKGLFIYVLRESIGEMYPPACPYEFSLVPHDILSQAYERFLGATLSISTTSNGLAEIHDGERRRHFSIYYTRNYVAKRITARALQSVVSNRKYRIIRPKTNPTIVFLEPLRILDPACGSGTFLAEAYQWLLDWYLTEYLASQEISDILMFSPAQRPRGIVLPVEKDHKGELGLTIEERRRILEEHIYGIDIDREACETTRLTLGIQLVSGLRVLQFASLDGAILPDLSNNIVCGNTLILDSEITPHLGNLSDSKIVELNPLSFTLNGLDLRRPCFHVIIGNPPYRRERDYRALHDDARITDWGRSNYTMRMDIWFYFVHRSLDLLVDQGILSFIVNSYFIGSSSSRKMISALHAGGFFQELLDLGDLKVFDDVSGRHLIFRFMKNSDIARSRDSMSTAYIQVPSGYARRSAKLAFQQLNDFPLLEASSDSVLRHDSIVLPESDGVQVGADQSVVAAIPLEPCPSVTLESVALIRQGIAENPSRLTASDVEKYCKDRQAGAGVFQLRLDEIQELGLEQYIGQFIFPYHTPAEIYEFKTDSDPPFYILYSTEDTVPSIEEFPELNSHLARFRNKLMNRREVEKGARSWWHLHWPRDPEIWTRPKIISVNMGVKPPFAYSYSPLWSPFSTNLILPQTPEYTLEFLTGLLNSSCGFSWFKRHAKRRGAGVEINGRHLRAFPVPDLDSLIESRLTAKSEVEVLVTRIFTQLRQGCPSLDDLPARPAVARLNEIISNNFGYLYSD
jgi:adenine-specific DNA-methyltransferase